MFYHIPIEPYDTRYTADWISQFEREFLANGVKFKTILGSSVSLKVSCGGVLDTCGTHLYKFSQLNQLIDLIRSGVIVDGDIIFFSDLWFPGLESLFYIRNMTNVKFKICGIFHAGTYDSADFTCRNGMRSWGKYLESCWFSDIDTIFVATEFHKQLILSNSKGPDNLADKIVVTGLPFYGDDLSNRYLSDKENILVFPHRCDAEKHPELFDRLVDYLKAEQIEFIPIKTILETSSRDEYFKLLGKSKVMVSFADQETFGYSTLESMALENVVVVPNKLSYIETVPRDYRYDTLEESFQRVKDGLLNYKVPNYDVAKWKFSIQHMLVELGAI